MHREQNVADTRIHGTTRRQVGKLFEEAERAALRPLPPEYLTRTVWVRWDARLVRIFNHRFEQIALHVRHEQGRFSTQGRHIAREKISGLERGAAYLLARVSIIGDQTRQWSEAMLSARGIEGTRVLLGLPALTKKYSSESLEIACEMALAHGGVPAAGHPPVAQTAGTEAGAAAVSGRASADASARRLRPDRRPGAGENQSGCAGMFSEAWLGK